MNNGEYIDDDYDTFSDNNRTEQKSESIIKTDPYRH